MLSKLWRVMGVIGVMRGELARGPGRRGDAGPPPEGRPRPIVIFAYRPSILRMAALG